MVMVVVRVDDDGRDVGDRDGTDVGDGGGSHDGVYDGIRAAKALDLDCAQHTRTEVLTRVLPLPFTFWKCTFTYRCVIGHLMAMLCTRNPWT